MWMRHPPRVPVLLGLDQGVIHFVTFCVEGRRHVLDNDDAFAAFRQVITRLDWHIIAAVIMPDHVHLLAGPRDRDAAGRIAVRCDKTNNPETPQG
jgi:REP element-mobilizing transposase RayT